MGNGLPTTGKLPDPVYTPPCSAEEEVGEVDVDEPGISPSDDG